MVSDSGQIRSMFQRWRVPALEQALDELAVWRERCMLLTLYRQYFPTEFARSRANSAPPLTRADGYADRELEFLELINTRLFPIARPDDYLAPNERFDYIPFLECSVEWFSEEDLAQLRVPLQVFICLSYEADLSDELLPDAPAIQPGPRDWERFHRLCRRAGGIFTDARLGLDVVSHSTGNVFFDSTSEMGSDRHMWGPEELAFLTAEWQRASELQARLGRLVERFEREPAALVRLVTLWNRAVEKKEAT